MDHLLGYFFVYWVYIVHDCWRRCGYTPVAFREMAPWKNPNERQLTGGHQKPGFSPKSSTPFRSLDTANSHPRAAFQTPEDSLHNILSGLELRCLSRPSSVKGFLLYSVVLLGGRSLWKDACSLVALYPPFLLCVFALWTRWTWLPPFIRPHHRPNSNRANWAGTEVYEIENQFILFLPDADVLR